MFNEDGTSESDGRIVNPDLIKKSPAEALQIIADSPEQLLVLDLDLTLVLGPTTEAFLDSARPSSYARVLLFVLEKLAPWRLLPGRREDRDWVRVLVLLVLMPWSYLRWRSIATSWAKANANESLVVAAQNHKGRVVVITRGFSAITNPVVNALQLTGRKKVLTIACKIFRWRGLRQFSKSEQIERSSKFSTPYDSIVVSDSIQDKDLFDVCQTPVLTEWEGAYWIQPHKDAYVPLLYVQLTKNPFKGFVQVGWIKDDLYIVLLAFSVAAWTFPIHAIGIALLSLSLWITYETGYYENDMVGSVREDNPVLPANFSEVRGSVPRYAPWIWALGVTIIGALFIVLGSSRSMQDIVFIVSGWMAILGLIRLVFALFNRLPKNHRVIPHLFLQIGKYLGYAAITASNGIGIALALTQVAYRWVPYVFYRWLKRPSCKIKGIERIRLSIFVVFATFSFVFIDYSVNQMVVFGLVMALLGRRTIRESNIKRGSSRRTTKLPAM